MALAAQALEAKKAWKAFETCEALGLIAACIKREYEGTNGQGKPPAVGGSA